MARAFSDFGVKTGFEDGKGDFTLPVDDGTGFDEPLELDLEEKEEEGEENFGFDELLELGLDDADEDGEENFGFDELLELGFDEEGEENFGFDELLELGFDEEGEENFGFDELLELGLEEKEGLEDDGLENDDRLPLEERDDELGLPNDSAGANKAAAKQTTINK